MKASTLHPGWYRGSCPKCGEEFMAAKRTPVCDDCWHEHYKSVTRDLAKQRIDLAKRRLERAREELAAAEAALASLPAPLMTGRE